MSKVYFGNAFSLNMISSDEENMLSITPMNVSEVSETFIILGEEEVEICIGHADIFNVVAESLRQHSFELGEYSPSFRKTVILNRGDELIVAQYSGPRLPEGTTSLPEGAQIKWLLVRVL